MAENDSSEDEIESDNDFIDHVDSSDDDNDAYQDMPTILQFLDMEDLPDWTWDNLKDDFRPSCIPTFDPPRGKVGPTRDNPPGIGKAVDYFMLFYTEELLDEIVRLTNDNAEAKHAQAWTPLNVDELKAFIGVRIILELTYSGRYEDIWNTKNPLIGLPSIASIFTRDRFTEIFRFIHFCSEENATEKKLNDRLYKVRYLTDYLCGKFQKEYTPDVNVSIDECMVPFRGRLSFKQYFKDKPIKWGIKVWMLAESKTGYNYNFMPYIGKDATAVRLENLGLATKVVCELCQPIYDHGYNVYFDRFFTSPTLLFLLQSQFGTSACGTVMPNRKGFPRELVRAKKEMERGDASVMVERNTGMVATTWCDSKPIYFLSNIHIPAIDGLTITRHNSHGNAIEVPTTPSVVEYNKHMGGVDLNDKMTRLDKSRKQYKWYMRLERKCIFWSVFNAYVIEKHFVPAEQGKRKRDFHSFCLDLCQDLIGDFSCRKKKAKTREVLSPRLVQGNNIHLPEYIRDGSEHQCTVCFERYKRYLSRYPNTIYKNIPLEYRKSRTSIRCTVCQKFMCVSMAKNCFADWHKKVEYWR